MMRGMKRTMKMMVLIWGATMPFYRLCRKIFILFQSVLVAKSFMLIKHC
ncbi:hypothetical protein QN277_029177 [Acacia crassicarpa]|uniref:Uncharacterized protein n=1 Tax=Acacia crassicarpa TaxID=499986 RepID=A0AAE1J7A6_9FABA|nr:hypothetical protein QN277_029177 [Acacia crassicarpa]